MAEAESGPGQERRDSWRWADALAPLAVGVLFLIVWEAAVTAFEVPHYVLPGPVSVVETLVRDWQILILSLLNTLRTTLWAFLGAALGGLGIALLFVQSRWIERSLFPYAVILQVTPIVAIAPLIIIWVNDDLPLAVAICAWIVAFFPVVSNTTQGLRSVDHNLLSLFELYGASRRQIVWQLRLPTALPYYLAGLRISGGLALIGAVVAEFVAGSGGTNSGLAYRILESGFRIDIPRMFAALFLISVAGIAIFAALTWLQHMALRRWHESAAVREV